MWGKVGVQCRTRAGVEGLLPLLHSGPPNFLMAFSGTFDYTLDAKNRLTVPAKMRTALTGTVVLSRGTQQCLTIWLKDEFHAFVATALEGVGLLDPKRDNIKRFFFSYAFEVELDSAGRVMLPSRLMELAGLDKEVVVNGIGDRIEIWDRPTWNAFSATQSIDDLAALFADSPGA